MCNIDLRKILKNTEIFWKLGCRKLFRKIYGIFFTVYICMHQQFSSRSETRFRECMRTEMYT